MNEDYRYKALLEIEGRLRELDAIKAAFVSVDSQDWDFLFSCLGDGGRGRFWKTVLTEARPALTAIR